MNAQFASQDELKKAAQTFFDEENYIEAMPLYAQLLSLYPKDPEYNYKYGACYFYGNREKEEALKYLNFAAGKPNVNPQAYYFLGLALHHEYRFSEAEANYNKFKEKGTAKDIQNFQVDRKIEMCRNGVTLLKSMTDIGVLLKKEIKASEFFRSYDLRGIGGKIVVKPDEFKTKLDIKNKEYSIIHIGDKPTMVVFSSYGNDGKTGKDIYKVVRLPDGEWSKPTPFSKINTNFDEDYPFLHPDGRTLYFSSKGYNSMGGYDIFKSTLNPETGEWNFPENLDFPINTPDDDILFISDIDNQLAYFASSRASKQGELTVYKVQVDRQPAENTIVKGFFLAESNPNMKSATISIMDVEKDRKYGVFSSNRENGEYLLVFPGNGGKFKILVETTNDAPVHSALIELPVLDGFRALKQELRLVGTGNNEKLVVKNLFDESDEFDITDPLVVENLLKYKAKMDVNLTEDEALQTIDKSTNIGIGPLSSLTNQELVDKAKSNSAKISENAKLSKVQANYAYDLAMQKSTEAKKALNQSQQKEKIAGETDDEATKAQALKDADRLKLIAAGLVNEAVAAIDVAKSLESEAVERESDVKTTSELSNSIATKINSGNRVEAETAYKKLDEIANSTYNKESALATEKEVLETKLSNSEIEYGKVRNDVIALKNRETEINENIQNLDERINKSSKKSEKEAWQGEINALKVDLEDTKYDLGVASEKELKLSQELELLKNKNKTSLNVIASVEKVNAQTTTKTTDKTALNNDIVYFEKQGLVGIYPTESTVLANNNSKSFNLIEHKDEYDIISDEGKIVDYGSKHSSAIVDAQNNPNEYQKSLEMAKINQDWILDINQEIAIKEKQLQAADNLNDKTKASSRIEVLKNLKAEKQKEADKFLLLAQEQNSSSNKVDNATSNQNTSTTTSKNNSTKANVSITDDSGNIIDYSTNYEDELSNINGDSPEDISKKITVYENWKNANEQELLLKKIELNNASDDDKDVINNRIEEIENQIVNNDEFIAIYKNKLNDDNVALNENPSSNKTNSSATNSNSAVTPNSKSIDYSKYDSNVIDSNGEVLDYSTTFNDKFSKADNIVDPLASSKEKQKITKEWIRAIDEELAFKNEQLSSAKEIEKPIITKRIDELTSEKVALNEQLSDIGIVIGQQEKTLAANKVNSVANSNSNAVTTNPTLISSGLNSYSSQIAKKELEEVTRLESELAVLSKQVEDKSASAYALKDETKKQQALNEISVLKADVENKKLEIAKANEKANKAEFYNNQAAISSVKKSVTNSSDNSILAELNEDESNTYFDKAQEERTKANNSATFNAKESSLNKAQELEKIAIDKQRKSIELYSNKDANEVLASLPKENLEVKTNDSSTNSSGSVNKSTNNTVDNPSSVNSNSISTTNSSAKLYQPTKVAMPSDAEIAKAKTAEKEASRLEKLAVVLQDSAQKLTNKTEKEALIAEANSNNEKAKQLRKDAEVNYANAKELSSNEAGTVSEINSNRTLLSNEQLTEQDKELISGLSGSEISEIKNSSEYQEYATNKQESRRLIKAAEVDYIKADKLQEEAEDQKTLGISLNAMANAAQGDAKTKLLGQIQKLNGMIADSESKATASRIAATDKEIEALEKNKAADNALASNPKANNIKAIEKAEVYNNNYLENAIAKSSSSSALVAENPATTTNVTTKNATTEKTTNTEIADNNVVEENTTSTTPKTNVTSNNATTEKTTNTEIAENKVIEENTTSTTPKTNDTSNNTSTEKTTNIELADNNIVEENTTSTTPKTNNTDNTKTTPNNISALSNNTSLDKVDEIPTVLNQPIFVLTENKKAVYNENKKIPVAKLPEGLVFKVQIGAFRNPIPQDHFVGFAPISTEDAGNGITRYTAGLFNTFNMANEAKNSIRGIGYPDAFVVAFYNGKRININEARAMAEGGSVPSNTNNSTTLANNNASSTSNVNASSSTSTNKDLPAPKTNVELVEDGISTDVNKIKGVFFTVQVGVYSKPITAEQLNNVTPLNSERTSNGLIRYTSGVYPTIEEANAAKSRIVELGITDAFVIAYANGNRVGVNEAINFSSDKNNVATPSSIGKTNTTSNASTTSTNSTSTAPSFKTNPANNTTTNNTITNNTSNSNSVNSNATNPSTPTLSTSSPSNSETPKKQINQVEVGKKLNIVYKVLLGEYADEVPVEESMVYLKFSNSGIVISEKEGKTIYVMGEYPDYPSALDLQIQMKVEGIKSPKVIAFKDGTQIEVNEALELVKNYNE